MDFSPYQPGRRQDEAAESVHAWASADQPSCADLCSQLSIYAFYMCISLCAPPGNPLRAGEFGAVTASPLSGHWISHVKT